MTGFLLESGDGSRRVDGVVVAAAEVVAASKVVTAAEVVTAAADEVATAGGEVGVMTLD